MKVNKESNNIFNAKIDELKKIIPEAFTENKIDFSKFSQLFKEDISNADGKYTLNWVGKSEAIKNIKANLRSQLFLMKKNLLILIQQKIYL
jgi:adenine-specific DNA-methyltransferase